MKRIVGLFFTLSLLLQACAEKEEKLFTLIAPEYSNIYFKNELNNSPELNILTYLYFYNGAGVAAADFNADGLSDLYFTSNMGADRLYLNQGGLRFTDITEQSGINNDTGWTTGVTHVDINGDGMLDIYICKVAGFSGLEGHNLLYINQGPGENGIPLFKEDSHKYGLDFAGFSTQAAFMDYDLDGDLDMFLLNHSVHPNRTYGKGSQRTQVDLRSGDRLYRNDHGKFQDVSAEAGIFQGKIGYGLGLAVSDVNNDGYPDIYVGNDFFENDYFYINQKNGQFRDLISEDERYLGHTTHFSMGNDIADINNDGLADIISMDMLPEDLETYKTSGFEYPYPTYEYYLKNGYRPQYMQNTLHLNLGGQRFSEIGNMAGVSATEWSWGPLAADFDNDGDRDLYVANGIKGATNDMDFINFIANDNIQKRLSDGMTESDMQFINEIPEKKVANYFFMNQGSLGFENVTETWFGKKQSFSNGCVFADLDKDGDLDIVVNNLDEPAYLIENNSETLDNNHLQIEFRGKEGNKFGIGAKVMAYANGQLLYGENYTSRGYLSAIPPTIHLGLGKAESVDSLIVIWPSGRFEKLFGPGLNARIKLDEIRATGKYYEEFPATRPRPFLSNAPSPVGFVHREEETLDFNRDPLVPFANTHEGPAMAIGDVNGDGRDDLFIGGAKFQSAALYLQNEHGAFESVQEELFEGDAVHEDVAALLADFNGDARPELLVVSGGNEFKNGPALAPRLYINKHGQFLKDSTAFKDMAIHASSATARDFDKDGDQDLFIAADQEPLVFGSNTRQYLFENDGQGNFRDITASALGAENLMASLKDACWADMDGNGYDDLIVVGHWMTPLLYMNDGRQFSKAEVGGLEAGQGWWNTVKVADLDNDGDLDIVAGNWGLNSRLSASAGAPITLYSHDFEGDGKADPLVTYHYQGKETPFASKDELVKQFPFLNKEFLSYKSFAKAGLTELFRKEQLESASKKKVVELGSCVFWNNGDGNFTKTRLPAIAQASSIYDIAIDDINGDGYNDLLVAGNNYEISTQLGRMDALHGLILLNDKKGGFQWAQQQGFNISGPARNIEKIRIWDQDFYCITINNNSPVFLRINEN